MHTENVLPARDKNNKEAMNSNIHKHNYPKLPNHNGVQLVHEHKRVLGLCRMSAL